MKKLKIMIIIVIVIIVALIYSLLMISNYSKDTTDNYTNIINNDSNILYDTWNNAILSNKDEGKMSEFEDQSIVNLDKKEVTSASKFYTVANCIQKYFDLIINRNNTELFYILNNDYINSKQITEENVLNYVHNLVVPSNFTALEMNALEGINTELYIVYGKVLDKNKNGIGDDVFFIVDLGRFSHTFSITPLIDANYNNIKQINIKNKDIEIEKNDYNSFSYYQISDEELIRKYISNFKIYAIYNTRESYNLLDKQYREKRFKNISEYENYIKENIDNIRTSILDSYKVTKENGITIYDYIDTNGNHYIFKETAIMQYSVLLDNYTILPADFNEYNEQNKLNFYINQFINMINYKDYNAIYNKLNTVFKNNNFSSISDLEQYLKNNTYDINQIEIHNIQQNDDYYICTCGLINLNNKEESKKINIILRLIDSNNFEMSFSFE